MKWIALWMVLAGGSSSDLAINEQVARPAATAKSKSTTGKRRAPSQKKQYGERSNGERSITDIRSDLRSGLRTEAIAKDGTSAQHEAIGTLIKLHREMVRHSTFEGGFALKESRALLQNRLVRIERDIRKRFDSPRKKTAMPKKSKAPAHLVIGAPPVLAQQVVPIGGQAGLGGNGQGGAGQFNGGGGAGQGAGGRLPDFGPDLADLIQQVIDPDFWDVNGGPGTIVYFQPLKALVISATAEVHENLADVLGQLRAAN